MAMFLWSQVIFFLLGLIWLCSARQFCGSELADVMSLVCQDRGYNMAFKAEIPPSDRRYKRGIVDECCKRGCSWTTLETYCSPSSSSDLQIRKRSDFSNKWQPEITDTGGKKHEIFKYDTSEIKIQQGVEDYEKWKLNILVEKKIPDRQNRFVPLWNRKTQNPRGPSIVNKVKRNDIEEVKGPRLDENSNDLINSLRWKIIFNDGLNLRKNKSDEETNQENSTNIVSIRHHHRKSDMSRRLTKGSGINSSQIGTVPPYFQGRTLVLPPRQH